jgi:hypothetical protein
MTNPVQVIAVSVSATLMLIVLELVRRRKLTEEYSFIWIVCACALLLLSLWRNILDVAARVVGVYYPPAVLLLVLTFFVVLVSLYFSVVVSRQRQQIERLVEEIALLDADVRELRHSVGAVTSQDVMPRAPYDGGETRTERRVGCE